MDLDFLKPIITEQFPLLPAIAHRQPYSSRPTKVLGFPQPLKMFGTKEQKEKYLPRFAKGEISAFALTEVDVGSDPAQMTTTATEAEDGEFYHINGTKL